MALKFTNNLDDCEGQSNDSQQAEQGPMNLQIPQMSSCWSDQSDKARRNNLHNFIFGLSF